MYKTKGSIRKEAKRLKMAKYSYRQIGAEIYDKTGVWLRAAQVRNLILFAKYPKALQDAFPARSDTPIFLAASTPEAARRVCAIFDDLGYPNRREVGDALASGRLIIVEVE